MLTQYSKWYDISTHDVSEENVREAVAYVLAGLANSVVHGTGTTDFNLPFEINIRIEQKHWDWMVKATTTLEYKQAYIDKLEAKLKEWGERFE